MRHGLALSIKFISTLVVLGIILGLFYNLAFTEVLMIAVVLTLAGYILGDLFILRRTNNLSASLADFGLALIIIYLLSRNMAFANGLFTASFLSAAAIAFTEYFYHSFISRLIPGLREEAGQNNRTNRAQFQTEASEELAPVRQDVRSPKDPVTNERNKNKNKNRKNNN
ncbi:YndM family protein [Peribacillus sp. SCS-155]|uniref:YndM family protein n=1 Tax=Peribacillus sedimenti TaxID=3115297 RepID=UPI0039067E8D